MAKWIRSAYWIGKPHAGREQAFREVLDGTLIPAMKLFPGVSDVKALWPQRYEDNAPELHCQIVVEFASAEAMQLMMDSAERAALRPRVLDAVGMFDGALSHIDHIVGA